MENVRLLCDFAAATVLTPERGFYLELGLTDHSLSAPPSRRVGFCFS